MQQKTGQHQQLAAVRRLFLEQLHRRKRQSLPCRAEFLEYAFIERERLYVFGLRRITGRAFLPQGIQAIEKFPQFGDPRLKMRKKGCHIQIFHGHEGPHPAPLELQQFGAAPDGTLPVFPVTVNLIRLQLHGRDKLPNFIEDFPHADILRIHAAHLPFRSGPLVHDEKGLVPRHEILHAAIQGLDGCPWRKNKCYNGIHADTEQCFLNPVYGEMKGILGFVNRHEADDQRDDAGNEERVAIVNACQHKIEHQAQIEGQHGQKEHTLLREKPEQDKGGDSPGDRAEHPQHALLQGLADARQADHEHGEPRPKWPAQIPIECQHIRTDEGQRGYGGGMDAGGQFGGHGKGGWRLRMPP